MPDLVRSLLLAAAASLAPPATAARGQSTDGTDVERFRRGLVLQVASLPPAAGTVRSPLAAPAAACRVANPSPACLALDGALVRVVLRWPAVAGAAAYRVEAREERGALAPWTWLHDVRGTADTMRVRNPRWRPVGVAYAWRVVALVAGAPAAESEPVRLVAGDPLPPDEPRSPNGGPR